MGKSHHFVLVHGGGHGAWCWYKTVELLRRAGHKATAVDLASCGRHCADPNFVTSFSEYNQPLVDLLTSLPDSEKVVLVGHDLGGLSVTHAMEHFAGKITAAVFLAAMMLPSGFQLDLELFELDPEVGDHIEYIYGNGDDHEPTSLFVTDEVQAEVFYHLCPPEDVILASLLIKAIPLLALDRAAISYTAQKHGTVPSVYIKTLEDRVLPAEAQVEAFLSDPNNLPGEIRVINSDHSPFFSAPEKLHKHLLEIARTYSK